MRSSGRIVWTGLWVLAFLTFSIGCTPNHSLTSEPTLEEPARPAAAIAMSDLHNASQLIHGFHDVEEGSWRWTKGEFAVSLGTPLGARSSGASVVFKFNLPAVLLQRFKAITLSCQLDHAPLDPETYTQPGLHEYRREAPARLFQNDPVLLEFSLDHFLPAGTAEKRELGLQAAAVALEPK